MIDESGQDFFFGTVGSHTLKNQITDSFGMGLIVAKVILEKHQGELLIERELGKGPSL